MICYKRNAMSCSYCRQFSKDNSTFGSQKSNKRFCLDEMKKNMKQVMCILLWTSSKTNNNLSSLIVNNFTFLEWHNILNE